MRNDKGFQSISPTNKPGFWDTRKQDPLVEELAKLLTSGDVLDIGAGWPGRDAFYLAEKGFNVTATEIDKESLAELNRRNKTAKNKIKIIDSDVRKFNPKQQFDAITSDMVLHFLQANEIEPTIRKMQDWTKPSGFNVVLAYTTKNPPGKRRYLFKPNELAEYYKDWKLVHYSEKPTPWFQLEGDPAPRRNEAVYLLVQKPN
jgi:tellurite methyltransferase